MLCIASNWNPWGDSNLSEASERIDTLRIIDALAKATEILAPQIGIDGVDLAEQRIDTRRMTRLNKLEILALSYFRRHENSWVRDFMNDYENYKMSEENHERAVLIVEALGNIGRSLEPKTKKPKDERSFVERHFTKRGQEPE